MLHEIQNLQEKLVSDLANQLSKKKEEIVNQKLIEKGYPPLSEYAVNSRFPRINISKANDWEYVFADNGTKQGDFIIAYRYVYDTTFDKSDFSAKSMCTIEFQDSDCSAVFLF